MKTTILSILMLFLIFPLFGQLDNEDLQRFNYGRNKSDSLVHSLEDLLIGRSQEERQTIEVLKDEMLYIDDQREIRNMFEIFGLNDKKIDSTFYEDFVKMTSYYMREYIGDQPHLDFDSNKVYLEVLTRKINNPPAPARVSSITQAIMNSDFLWQMDGYGLMYNFAETDLYYIPEISRFMGQIKFDEKDSLFPIAYIDTVFKASIVNKIQMIHDPEVRYRSYILFMENMATNNLARDLFETGSLVSEYIVNDYSISKEFKVQALIAISKIVATNRDRISCNLAMTNYGRLYALIDSDSQLRTNGVKRMELQMLNSLGKLYPRKSRFVIEGDRILRELLDSDKLVYSEQAYFENNLLLAEILVNQLKSRRDIDFRYSEEDFLYYELITQWRILNIMYEFKKFEKQHNQLPKEYHSRLLQILFDFHAIRNDRDGIILSLLSSLKSQKADATHLYTLLWVLPDLILQAGEVEESKKWAKTLDGYLIDFLFEGITDEQVHEHINDRINRPPYKFIEGDKEFWLSASSDFIINSYIALTNMWNNVPANYKMLLKETAHDYYEFESFFVENEAYKKAYVFGRLARLIRGNESDGEIFNDMISSRTLAYAGTSREILNREISVAQKKVENLNARIQNLIDALIKKENELVRKNRLIGQKDARLFQQDSIISLKDSEIVGVQEELAGLQREKKRLLKEQENLLADNKKIIDENGTLEEQEKELQASLNFSYFLIGILAFLLAIIALLFMRSVRRKKAIEKQKAIIEEQKILVEREKDRVVQEQKRTKALQLSIGQITHLCKDGVDNLLSRFFDVHDPVKFEKGKQALGSLVDSFQRFRENQSKFSQSIKDELALADVVCQFQNPGFSHKFAPSKLSTIKNRFSLSHREVPIYTLVNLMSNVIRHSELNDDLSVSIREDITNGLSTLVVESHADIIPSQPNKESTGLDYVESMVELLVEERVGEFTHGITPDGNGYQTLLPINS